MRNGKALSSVKAGFICSTLEAKLFVIKFRPYSMLMYTLSQIKLCLLEVPPKI
jgi:hypothetical protein